MVNDRAERGREQRARRDRRRNVFFFMVL